MTYSDTQQNATPSIAKTPSGEMEIRCSGRLACECGTRIKALDVQVTKDGDDITHVTLICPGCHRDLLQVKPC